MVLDLWELLVTWEIRCCIKGLCLEKRQFCVGFVGAFGIILWVKRDNIVLDLWELLVTWEIRCCNFGLQGRMSPLPSLTWLASLLEMEILMLNCSDDLDPDNDNDIIENLLSRSWCVLPLQDIRSRDSRSCKSQSLRSSPCCGAVDCWRSQADTILRMWKQYELKLKKKKKIVRNLSVAVQVVVFSKSLLSSMLSLSKISNFPWTFQLDLTALKYT